ncbi:hypothetical protein J2S22_000460 [Rhodoplanes tepidamans]|uniref:Uncharacterized protein n=1 Tax=Rhodoplanes tepidamans TaxID=200616 RepID=A0ABT5J6M2_RHOTP|nr:hypothetical protein [Rhodoplanes tepidamans]MDC7785296.1 hypothetical protein [Rhodoplanes tepidamans]MDQ0353554.1 hypothetical protein [Rhodoplanes tepidamans]
MARAGTVLRIALTAAAVSAALATGAEAGRRGVVPEGRPVVLVRPLVPPPHWYGQWGDGWAVTARYGRARPTTVYPYGSLGSGVRGWWYPGLINGPWGVAPYGRLRPCC